MDRIAVIDIDNTLWQFCDMLHAKLRKVNPDFPPVNEWRDWDFWEDYCTASEFFDAIHSIHSNQDSPEYRPYPEAWEFLSTLKEKGFHLIIASHRDPVFREPTENWLRQHGLPYDELHLSFDKTVLFSENCYCVIDDAPHILEKASSMSIRTAGLKFPWNEEYADNGFKLYNSLREIKREMLQDI